MRTKKTKQANLENQRNIFRQIGIIFAMGIIFITFEYTNADVPYKEYNEIPEDIIEIEYIPITSHKKTHLPPPPTAFSNQINITDVSYEIPDDMNLEDITDNKDYTPPILFDNTDEEEVDPDAIFVLPEKMPSFPGGKEALMRYLSKNIKYPASAMETGIKGRVYVKFVINKEGKIIDVQILKGIHYSIDQEALRVIKAMPNWIPGQQGGKAVNVAYQIPINFTLK